MSEKNNHVDKAIQYLTKAYNINSNSIYQEHIPYMIKNKRYLYNKDLSTTTTKEYEYSTVEEDGINKLSQKLVDRHKKQLRTHLQVCKEFASYFFNEKIDFKLSDMELDTTKATNEIEYLKKHYTEKDFWQRLEKAMIEVFGVGAVGIVANYDATWGIQTNFYDAYCILPLSIVDNKIQEVAFVGTDTIDDSKTRISLHRINWEEATYLTDEAIPKPTITKKANGYIVDTITLNQSGNLIEEESYLNRVSPVRLFVILRPFGRNAYDYADCFGIPIFEDAKDICQGIDDIYNAQRRDLEISENMLLASKNLFIDPTTNKLSIPERFKNGNTILLGEEHLNTVENKPIISLENLNTKINEYSQNLTEAYKMLSLNVGLGSETLAINKMSTPTATQVISDNNQKFTSLKKHFGQMRDEITVLNSAILFLASENTETKSLNYETRITFNTSDNILVDDETLKQQAVDMFQAGLMSVYRYLTEFENLQGQELIDELARLGYDENGTKKSSADFNNLFGNDDGNKDDNGDNPKDDDKDLDKNMDGDKNQDGDKDNNLNKNQNVDNGDGSVDG